MCCIWCLLGIHFGHYRNTCVCVLCMWDRPRVEEKQMFAKKKFRIWNCCVILGQGGGAGCECWLTVFCWVTLYSAWLSVFGVDARHIVWKQESKREMLLQSDRHLQTGNKISIKKGVTWSQGDSAKEIHQQWTSDKCLHSAGMNILQRKPISTARVGNYLWPAHALHRRLWIFRWSFDRFSH